MRINKRTLELNAWFLEKEEKGHASTFHLHPYILSNLLKDDDHRGLCSETTAPNLWPIYLIIARALSNHTNKLLQ